MTGGRPAPAGTARGTVLPHVTGSLPVRPLRLLLAAVALAAALWMFGARKDHQQLADAGRALADGRSQAAVRLARRAGGGPSSGRAEQIVSAAELQLGDLPAAERAAAAAVRAAPEDWARRYDHAVLLERLGRRADASREMARALARNPRLMLPPGFRRERSATGRG